MSCACGTTWRFVSCDLRTGTVRAILHPLAADFSTILNDAGQGSLTLATREVTVRDIWPHLTSLYILRMQGGAATPENPVVEFAGLIEAFDADSGGATKVGLKSIENYLDHRHIDNRANFAQVDQNSIGAQLVGLAGPDGIPLTAVGTPSAHRRDRTYESWDRKVIGEAVKELTDVENGPDWELVHTLTFGRWSTQMRFRDYVGVTRAITIHSDREASAYGLSVDAANHATHVDAIGEGEEKDMLIRTANDPSGIYPRFDAAPAWKDVSQASTLQSHADGYLTDYREPVAIPDVTIPSLDPDPDQMRLGDVVGIHTNYGAVTYKGQARIISRSWKIDAESPHERTYELTPLTRASEAVLSQTATVDCRECA